MLTLIASVEVASPRTAPLYKRLPRGPHRLTRDEVIRNQRTRIHGAMIEAIAQYGYEKTNVKYVVALAGVSRRAFYEQFANKEECFLTTFDLLAARAVKRTNEADRAADGDALESRLRAAFEQFAEEVGSSSRGATLIEAPMAGPAGMLHLCRATATFEQMLLRSFAHAPEASALPLPVVRGIVGGLYEVMSACLPVERAEETPRPDRGAAGVDHDVSNARPGPPGRARVRTRSRRCGLHKRTCLERARHERALRERACTNGHSMNGNATNGHAMNGNATNGYAMNGHLNNGGDASHLDARGRLLESVLRLTVLEDYGELSVPRIADEADVSLDDFFELFVDKEDCFLAAFDEMSYELLALTADPELVGEHWPRAVRRTIGALMRHLADHPLHARMIAAEVYAAGPDAIERNHELARDIATLLTEEGGSSRRDWWHVRRCRHGRDLAHGPLPGRERTDPPASERSPTICPTWSSRRSSAAEAAVEVVGEDGGTLTRADPRAVGGGPAEEKVPQPVAQIPSSD